MTLSLPATYEQAIAYLDDHIGAGIKPGLDRIRLLTETMGDPHTGYPIIHVAGTNGKTSTTRFAALLLTAHGLHTGTYTSPHLEVVEERLGINGRIATPDELIQAVADVAAFATVLEERGLAGFSYFELTTAMAFAFFAEQAVEAAVVEVGLGGRLDATNVVEAEVAVLTGVGLEHMEYLGDTIEAIATEKLAITSPGGTLVTGAVPPTVLGLAEAVAAAREATHLAIGRDFGVDAVMAVGGWQVDIHGTMGEYPEIHLPVHGRHQTANAAVAVTAVEALLGRALDPTAVGEAAASFATPGRMERVSVEPLTLLDGAHNPDGFRVLAATLAEEFPTIRWVLVLGVMGDKDLESMVVQLDGRLETVIATAPAGDRPVPPPEVARRVESVLSVPTRVAADSGAAITLARELAGSEGAVLVAGSLYLVGEVRRTIGSGR